MAHRAPRSTVGTPTATDHHDESHFSIGGWGEVYWPLKDNDLAELAALAWLGSQNLPHLT